MCYFTAEDVSRVNEIVAAHFKRTQLRMTRSAVASQALHMLWLETCDVPILDPLKTKNA